MSLSSTKFGLQVWCIHKEGRYTDYFSLLWELNQGPLIPNWATLFYFVFLLFDCSNNYLNLLKEFWTSRPNKFKHCKLSMIMDRVNATIYQYSWKLINLKTTPTKYICRIMRQTFLSELYRAHETTCENYWLDRSLTCYCLWQNKKGKFYK